MRKLKLSAGIVAAVGAMAAPAMAQTAGEARQLVGDLHAAFGQHHARAVHAKGIILEGECSPAPAAKDLSSAAVFSADKIQVVARFSDFTGIPDIPDTSDNANPRGFAIKLKAGQGGDLDIVAHSFNGFPTATAHEFGDLLQALAASANSKDKPSPVEKFLAGHPIAKTFLTTQKPPPESYATTAYFGVNSIAATSVAGKRTYLRFRFMPKAGEHYLDAAARKSKGPSYLTEEIARRVGSGPVEFDWLAQVSGPGDKIDDPSIAWPESRPIVKLGIIRLTRVAADQEATDKGLLFMPGNLPSGMEVADPMLTVRNEAYPISFGERQ